jgi:hypothetical protein
MCMMKSLAKTLFVFYFLSAFSLFSHVASAAVLPPGNIGGCGELAAPGTYTITGNIGGTRCLLITSSGVILAGTAGQKYISGVPVIVATSSVPGASGYSFTINSGSLSLNGTADLTGGAGGSPGTLTFANGSRTQSGVGVVIGNSIFNTGSQNYGTTTGTATFNDNSTNIAGVIYGTTTFNGTSYNQNNNVPNFPGAFIGPVIFNGTSRNAATFYSSTTFNGSSYNQSNLYGTTTFNDSSYNSGIMYGTSTSFWGTSRNQGTSYATTTFNGSSRNASGIIYAGAIFNDSSYNQAVSGSPGPIRGGVVFNGSSYNAGTLYASTTFNGSATNQSNLYATTTFNDLSYNRSLASGPVRFSAASFDEGINPLFYPGSTYGSSLTFTYPSGITFNVASTSAVWSANTSSWIFASTPTWIFSGSGSRNTGTIPNATFSGSGSYNTGTISGTTTISNDLPLSSVNQGGSIQHVVFNGASYNDSVVPGNATFNSREVSLDGSVTVDSETSFVGTGVVQGSVFGLLGKPILSWNLTGGSVLTGILKGDVNFIDTSYSVGTTTGNATFSSFTASSSVVTVDGTPGFRGTGIVSGSVLDSAGSSITSWDFRNGSYLFGNLKGNARFLDSLYGVDPVRGVVTGTIEFPQPVTFNLSDPSASWTSNTSSWSFARSPLWVFSGVDSINTGNLLGTGIFFSPATNSGTVSNIIRIPASSGVIYDNETGDGLWNTVGNWMGGNIPAPGENAVLLASTTLSQDVAHNIYVGANNLTFDGGNNTLTGNIIGAGYNLNLLDAQVVGNVSTNGGGGENNVQIVNTPDPNGLSVNIDRGYGEYSYLPTYRIYSYKTASDNAKVFSNTYQDAQYPVITDHVGDVGTVSGYAQTGGGYSDTQRNYAIYAYKSSTDGQNNLIGSSPAYVSIDPLYVNDSVGGTSDDGTSAADLGTGSYQNQSLEYSVYPYKYSTDGNGYLIGSSNPAHITITQQTPNIHGVYPSFGGGLSWNPANGADGYMVVNDTCGYYLDVGNVNAIEDDGSGCNGSWSSGSPSFYTTDSYQYPQSFSTDLSWDPVDGADGYFVSTGDFGDPYFANIGNVTSAHDDGYGYINGNYWFDNYGYPDWYFVSINSYQESISGAAYMLNWADVDASGYVIQNLSFGYYTDVGNVTSFYTQNDYDSPWVYGSPTIFPVSPYIVNLGGGNLNGGPGGNITISSSTVSGIVSSDGGDATYGTASSGGFITLSNSTVATLISSNGGQGTEGGNGGLITISSSSTLDLSNKRISATKGTGSVTDGTAGTMVLSYGNIITGNTNLSALDGLSLNGRGGLSVCRGR